MNWQEHMRRNALNWLTKGDDRLLLDPNFLMLFGNPYLFQKEAFTSLVADVTPAGVFYRGRYKDTPVSFCHPLFGAPAVAMYVEVIARLGVKNVIGCGYVGGIGAQMEIGSYAIPSFAYGLDGCTRAYFPHRFMFPSSSELTARLGRVAQERGAKAEVGPVASIDALMLEDDLMIQEFSDQAYCCVDLETACLYALAGKLGLSASGIHIVSDNPRRKLIDESRYHEASFPDQVGMALEALRGGR